MLFLGHTIQCDSSSVYFENSSVHPSTHSEAKEMAEQMRDKLADRIITLEDTTPPTFVKLGHNATPPRFVKLGHNASKQIISEMQTHRTKYEAGSLDSKFSSLGRYLCENNYGVQITTSKQF